MNTYERYRQALEEIANGTDNAQALAAAALVSRKPILDMGKRIEAATKKERWDKKCQATKARDHDIYIRREWGEPIRVLADEYKISTGRVQGILANERQLTRMRSPRCIRCGHSGGMHHDENWNYVTGPCAEYECDCPAMDAGHD